MSAPVLTPYVDAAPCPRVEVFFPSFDAGTASVTVYRLAGGQERQVRGAVGAPTGGTFTRIDFEVPFNVPVTYRAEQFNATGVSIGFTPSASLTVVSPDTWMHNPLNPEGAVRVALLDSAVKRLARPVPGEISRPLGRRVGVVLSSPRQGLKDAVFDVFASTFPEADAVQALVGNGFDSAVPVICIRPGSDNPMRVPLPLFLGVLGIPEEDVSVRYGGQATVHRIEGDEVDPPIPGLFVPLLTRADLNAAFATRAALNAGGLTRADINRRYDLAGTAG